MIETNKTYTKLKNGNFCVKYSRPVIFSEMAIVILLKGQINEDFPNVKESDIDIKRENNLLNATFEIEKD